MYKYMESNASHIVVIGPNGFQMCSWLQVVRRGLPCRHIVAALVTELKRVDELKGESIHHPVEIFDTAMGDRGCWTQ